MNYKLLLSILSIVLLSGCANDRDVQIENACKQVELAWDVYAVAYKADLRTKNLDDVFTQRNEMSKVAEVYIPEASAYLREAGLIFRSLSANDSGFAAYAESAFETAALNGFQWSDSEEFGNRISKLYYFCGIE